MMKNYIQKFFLKRKSLLEVHLKQSFPILIGYKFKKSEKTFEIKKSIQKLLNKQSVLQECLRSTSSTPQLYYPYFHWFLTK